MLTQAGQGIAAQAISLYPLMAVSFTHPASLPTQTFIIRLTNMLKTRRPLQDPCHKTTVQQILWEQDTV